jgi:O-antigen/teichoic acid export membrane protein
MKPLSMSYRQILQGILPSTAADVLSKVAILLTAVAAARLLDPSPFAQYVGLFATSLIAAAAWEFGSTTVITREIAAQRMSVPQALLQSANYRIKTLVVWFPIFLFGVETLTRIEPVPFAVISAFALNSLLLGLSGLLLAIMRGELRFLEAGAALASGRWLTAALSVAALSGIVLVDRLLLLALALSGGEILTIVITSTMLLRSTTSGLPGSTSSRLGIRASAPFALNGLLNTAYNRFDVVLLAALTTAPQLALYAPASRLQDALYLVPSAVGVVALPLFARSFAAAAPPAETVATIARVIRLGLALTLPIVLLVSVTATELLATIFGPDYVGSATAVRIVAWSIPFAAIASPLLAALAAIGRGGDTTKIFATAFLVALGLHLALDPWLGATGGALASFSRDPACTAVALVLARRAGLLDGFSTPWRSSESTPRIGP